MVRRQFSPARCLGVASALALVLSLPSAADADAILPSGSMWEYTFADPTADPTWTRTLGLGGPGGWLEGPAPFSNVDGVDPYGYNHRKGTYWAENRSDFEGPIFHDNLWVRRTVDLTHIDLNTVSWQMAVDNGYKMYLNGALIGSDNQEGYTWVWEYAGIFPNAIQGTNILAIALEDHGVRTAFDMEITGTPVPTPEPGTIALVGMGGLALAARFRRRKR